MTAKEDNGGLARREFLQRGAAGALALSAAGILDACGSSSSSSSGASGASSSVPALSKGPPAGGTPVRGGTLRTAATTGGASETIDPRKLLAYGDIYRGWNLYEPMFYAAPGGLVTPGLVVEGIPNKAATLWTFKLRDGVHWHDGKPFTADDIVYTIKASWTSKVNPFSSLALEFVDVAGVRKLDPLTVQIPLHKGIAAFPSLTFAQTAWVVQNGTTNWNNGNGTGPFKLESFTPGSRSVFTANKDYWQSGLPYVDTLMVDSSFTTDEARLNALLAGDLDICPLVPPALAKANAASGQIVLGNQPGPGFIAPAFRTDKAPFTDVRVIEAFRLIPNRPEDVLDAFDGYATPGNDCPCSTDQYWASDLKRTQDIEKAKSLLKAAGQENLTITLYTSDISPGMNETATLYAAQAAQAGLKVNVQVVSPSVYEAPSGSPGGNYPDKLFNMLNWSTGTNSLTAFYLQAIAPNCPYPETHFGTAPGHEQANALLFDAVAETNPASAADKWHAVQELQFNRGGYIITENYNWLDAYSHKVRGVQTTEVGPCNYFDFKQAWLTG